MSGKIYDISNTQVQLTMVLKLQQLQREALPFLTYGNLEDYLSGCLWKRSLPATLHEAADEIMSVEADDIVRFLSRQAVIEGSKQNLEDFTDVIGG